MAHEPEFATHERMNSAEKCSFPSMWRSRILIFSPSLTTTWTSTVPSAASVTFTRTKEDLNPPPA